MNKFRSLISIALVLTCAALFHSVPAFATADATVSNSSGFYTKQAADGKYYPAQFCYSTDGAQGRSPCREGGSGVTPGYLDTSSTNVTSSAYANVLTSTSDQAKSISVYNGSTTSMILAVAPSGGSYTDKILVGPSGWTPVTKLYIPAGASVGVKSKGSTISSGVVLINLVQ